MKHYAGLDVSIKETSVCIVDEVGKVCREMRVPNHPEDLARALNDPARCLERVGLQAGPLSQWLFSGLVAAGLPAVCIETRHTKAFLKAQVNKSDRNDPRGIAQMMRVNLLRPVHVKTVTNQRRTLTDDAGDAFLAVFTNGRVTGDKVGGHSDLLAEFPYLGPPHNA